MKFLSLALLVLAALHSQASATNAVLRLKEQIQQAPTQSSMPGSAEMVASSRMSSMESSSAPVSTGCTSGSCIDAGSSAGLSSVKPPEASPEEAVDDAVRPIDDWLKAFRRKNDMDSPGADLYRAARAVVTPLLNRLKQSQEAAVDQLRDSNERILRRVEEASVEYITQLLKTDREKDDKAARAEEMKMKIENFKDTQELAKTQAMAEIGVPASAASAIASAIQSAGVSASQNVVSKIAQLVQSASQSS